MFRDAIARLSIVSFATVGRPLVYLGGDYLLHRLLYVSYDYLHKLLLIYFVRNSLKTEIAISTSFVVLFEIHLVTFTLVMNF